MIAGPNNDTNQLARLQWRLRAERSKLLQTRAALEAALEDLRENIAAVDYLRRSMCALKTDMRLAVAWCKSGGHAANAEPDPRDPAFAEVAATAREDRLQDQHMGAIDGGLSSRDSLEQTGLASSCEQLRRALSRRTLQGS